MKIKSTTAAALLTLLMVGWEYRTPFRSLTTT